MPVNVDVPPRPPEADAEAGPNSLKSLVRDYERGLIVAALEATRGHQRRAAAILGVSPSSLHEKMRRLGVRIAPSWAETQRWA
jgi:DNA-binding NtrC family response regulator